VLHHALKVFENKQAANFAFHALSSITFTSLEILVFSISQYIKNGLLTVKLVDLSHRLTASKHELFPSFKTAGGNSPSNHRHPKAF
jgi:hypothetical protein